MVTTISSFFIRMCDQLIGLFEDHLEICISQWKGIVFNSFKHGVDAELDDAFVFAGESFD